ncbi:MAG: hypothetical protein V7638_4824 [Acidobacteriota bacterium]|jgi:hypothetical protein
MAQNPLELERVRYWQGQLLASGDLNTQLRVDQELRRLHNRSLHQPYGIAIGLELERDDTTHDINLDDDDNVRLTCGLAYDCAGRELILQANRALDLPDEFPATLVITRDESASDGIAVKWKAQSEINPNSEIAITTLTVGLPNPKTDPAFRQVVSRPLARPRMATGQTIPGETTWQPWKIGDIEVGVKVEIDTSAAGFTRIPHYFAEVIPGSPTADFIPAWFASIDAPSTQGFTFQLMLRRITRESLRIVDPKAQIAETPALKGELTLDAGNLFAAGDLVARLLPLAQDASIIKTINNQTATLDKPLSDFAGTKLVAFGNTRREAIVTTLSPSALFFEVTVAQRELFAQGDVVVKTNGNLESTRPSRVVTIDDEGTLEVAPPITGLVKNDTLTPVKPGSEVDDIGDGIEIKVKDSTSFKQDDVVARLTEPTETSPPAKILEKKADNVLVLSNKIPDLKKDDSLGFARDGSVVDEVNDNSNEVTITLDSVVPFKELDVVAKSHPNGSFSAPVLVRRVFTSSKKIRLSTSIAGLVETETIVAADFSIRATVVNVTSPTTITVANAALFSIGSYVAKIDDLFRGSLPVQVSNATGQTLTLTAAIDGLKAGDVIGLCTFPVAVKVDAIRDDGSIEVSPAGLLRNGDLITAPAAAGEKTALSLITNVAGNAINLIKPFPHLVVNDRLSVVSVRGAIQATHTATGNKMDVDQPARLRRGDFLADITSWRQVQAATGVQSANGNEIQMDAVLDGSLLNDVVGLASIDSQRFRFFTIGFIRLRLEKSLVLVNGDEVLLIGFDRLTGLTQNLSARVTQFIPATKTLTLMLFDASRFIFRPEDIFASILFVRGSAMALIQNHDLFVSWLAVGESEQMPRPCIEPEAADCECSQAKE